MQTIELIITKNKKPQEILKALREKRLKRGDSVRLKAVEINQSFAIVVIFCLFIIIWYLTEGSKKKAFGEEVEEILFKTKMSTAELEKKIKKEFGVSVEIEHGGFAPV